MEIRLEVVAWSLRGWSIPWSQFLPVMVRTRIFLLNEENNFVQLV